MNYERNHAELRLVNDPDAGPDGAPAPEDGERGHSELVAEVIGEAGLLTPDKLEQVRTRAVGGTFSQALIDEGFASALGVARALAEQYHLPLVDLAVAGVDPVATRAIALNVLDRVCAIPFASDGAALKLAITDPQNVRGLDELRLATRRPIEFHVAAKNDVLTELRRLSRAAEAQNAAFVSDAAAAAEADEDDLEADDGISDAPLVRLVNSLIFQAAEEGASDIHVEPQEHELIVRFRVDGVLHVAQRIPKRLTAGVTTRLKVLSKLDIAERRKPQDGRITLTAAAAGRMLDIRVAVLPTVEGETVTMRLLDKSREVPTLESLGLSVAMRAQMSEILARPTGALLVTGPTGSGKSTTLYAALAATSRPEINIITVEDPVEYRLAGIKQVQINPRAGLTFATALRSILRSDPDVVMVGEIRDGETARISIEAALTGHLVLSTLHTNDAPSALTRLNEMGVEPFITGAAVSAVLAQRLARKLCPHCAIPYEPSLEELRALHVDEETVAALVGSTFSRRAGCARCGNTGYRGRIGVFQLLEMTPRLEQLASEKAPREEIDRAARADGMRSLWHDGVAKVAAGVTTVEELARVCTL
ncbi:MAG: GspE/PulE family protein [Actinomycetota bacterium]|nr:GspE/PulE family protein [Actinomycetota bacterium]